MAKLSARREGTLGTEGTLELHPAGQLRDVSQAVDIGLIHFGDPEAVRAARHLKREGYSGY